MTTAFEKYFVNEDLVESYAKGRPSYPPHLSKCWRPLQTSMNVLGMLALGMGRPQLGYAFQINSGHRPCLVLENVHHCLQAKCTIIHAMQFNKASFFLSAVLNVWVLLNQ
jgi:hypothetical protein